MDPETGGTQAPLNNTPLSPVSKYTAESKYIFQASP